jgi:bifunctional DNA-binding transcriptional regulator/antitoxin component of YhaV-PrlF toxin-antitoxin module
MKIHARLDPNGRLTLPARLRQVLALQPGDLICLHLENDGSLRLLPPGLALQEDRAEDPDWAVDRAHAVERIRTLQQALAISPRISPDDRPFAGVL